MAKFYKKYSREEFEDFFENEYDGYDFPSEANKTTDIIGFGEIGGIGQLVYHTIRFSDYEYEQANGDEWFLKPIINRNDKLEFHDEEGLSGVDLLYALYNLAKEIDENKDNVSTDERVIEFCKTVAHPYFIDELYGEATDKAFVLAEDGYHFERDAMFRVSDFISDLKRFYTTMKHFLAFKETAEGTGTSAFTLYEDSRFFDGLPFFEKYKSETCFDETPRVDDDASLEDLFGEKMNAEQETADSSELKEKSDWFVHEPADYIHDILDLLLDTLPNINMRLKRNPQDGKVVFAADVHSVFDIAYYTLARKLATFNCDEFKDEIRGRKGVIATCLNCGRAFRRTTNMQMFCKNEACRKAHNAMRQKKYRENKKVKAVSKKRKKEQKSNG